MTKQNKHSKFQIIVVSVLILLVVVVGFNVAITLQLRQQNETSENRQLASLILDAVRNLGQPLVRDSSGAMYIPEARLSLPAPPNDLGDVIYSYTPPAEGIGEEVRIASKISIHNAETPLLNINKNVETTFDAVPKLQACARGIQITFAPIDGLTPADTKQLTTDKTAYFYTEELCQNDILFDYVKKIEAY